MSFSRSIGVGSVLFVCLLVAHAEANTITWGGGTGNWNTPANWTGGILPTTGDTAVVNSGRPTVNATLSPAPDVIQVNTDGTAYFTASNTNSFVLSGGKFDSGGDYNPVLSGMILLTADSTIQNTHGNSNRSFTVSSNISEDGTPRKLTLSGYPATGGTTKDNTYIGGTSTYTGGTDVLGATNYLKSLGALGSGPVNVLGGRLAFSTSGDYTHGTVTMTSGTIIVGARPTNEVWQLQGGTLTYNTSPQTLDATNHVTISNIVNIVAGGGYYNNAFTINAAVDGPGKAVLNSDTDPSGSIVQFGAKQKWTGGTDIKGIVEVLSGGCLPAGTVTVYPVGYGAGTGLLRLDGAAGLDPGTDLVLMADSVNNKYATILMNSNQTVHSLTVNGSVIPAGYYKATDFPSYILGTGTLTVLSPDAPPSTITDLAATSPTLTSVTLTWSAPSDSMDPGNTAVSYDIRYSTSPIDDSNWSAATPVTQNLVPKAPGAAESFVVAGLDPSTSYYYAIKSLDMGANVSAMSNVVTLTTLTPDSTPPAAVTDLSAINVDTRKLTLTWTASGNDGAVGTAYAYDIRMSTNPIDDSSFGAAQAVPQSLAPKPAGQTETLPVGGLVPGTTYYFAMKVSDNPGASLSGLPNWSGLSNVLRQATLPPDVTPPAAVTDLAAPRGDAFSVDLAWTATGDDGNVGTATRYEIRYSTSPIDDSNWSSASLAFSPPIPQPNGSAETFTVTALQPSTTYYFALKVKDEENNTSGLSNVATFTTAPLPNLPLVTTVTIAEKAGVSSTNYPVTLSMVFAKGDVPSSVIARVGGAGLPTQTDVKVRWPDGSVRHALVSFILPSLAAGSQVSVDLLSGGTNSNTTWMTKDQLLASDFEALMAITVGGVTTNVSARQMLQNTAGPDYWMKGSIASEFIIRDFSTDVAGQLNVSYRVRVYPSLGLFRVSTVVDNTWIDARGNLTYDFALSLGLSNPQVVFAKTNFTQWTDSRWHKVFWQGTTPSSIEVRYNLPYLVKTGALPNYDTSLVVSGAAVTNLYNTWNNSAHDIMDGAGLTKYFPTTGGRSEIGPYPQWASLYICSMDSRMAEVTTNYGDLSGSIPMHFREADPNRSFYCHPVNIDDRPTVWTSQIDVGYIQQYIAPADRFPAAIGDLNTPWTVDLAHQPSLAYIPYLITGDLYYLEEMHFWACFDLGASNGGYRGGSQGWLIDQLRGNAWAFRNVIDAAAMTPDTMPEKAYLEAKIANNISRWNTMFIVNTNYPAIRAYGTGSYAGESTIDPATCSFAEGIWQDDYFTWSFIHAFQQGYPTLDMIHWGGKGVIDRFTDWTGWNRYRAAVYAMPIKGKDANGNPADYLTWADVNNGFTDKVGPSSFSGNPNGYDFAARGVLALVSNLGNGPDAFNWAAGKMALNTYAGDPRWAFAPQYKAGDIDFDGQTNLADLKLLVAGWNTAYGQAGFVTGADLDADESINLADLKILVANWNQ